MLFEALHGRGQIARSPRRSNTPMSGAPSLDVRRTAARRQTPDWKSA
jgi:hypothetical protein